MCISSASFLTFLSPHMDLGLSLGSLFGNEDYLSPAPAAPMLAACLSEGNLPYHPRLLFVLSWGGSPGGGCRGSLFAYFHPIG